MDNQAHLIDTMEEVARVKAQIEETLSPTPELWIDVTSGQVSIILPWVLVAFVAIVLIATARHRDQEAEANELWESGVKKFHKQKQAEQAQRRQQQEDNRRQAEQAQKRQQQEDYKRKQAEDTYRNNRTNVGLRFDAVNDQSKLDNQVRQLPSWHNKRTQANLSTETGRAWREEAARLENDKIQKQKQLEEDKRRQAEEAQRLQQQEKQQQARVAQQEQQRKQQESMLAGLAAEKDALETLSLIHTLEDRSTWAANWKKGTENWDKPYAMDFYFPDRRTAVDIKFKSLNQQYQSFALDKDHYDKYQVYIDTYPDVNKGILWYIERTSKREYLLEMDHMKNCIERGMIQLRAGHKDYIRKGSSGQYYAIPLDCFKDITDEEWSVTGIKKRDSAAANPFTKL
jgi:hypothetical protein